MEWKLSGEVKPEYDDHVFFEERVNHSCFSLKRTPSSFYIFGGSSKYTKYNDVVQFKKHENPQHDNMEWTYSIVSKGNSYEGKKSSMFGLFGLGKSNNNLSAGGPQYPSLREGHTTIVWETEVLKVNPVTKAEEYVMEEQVILFGGYNGSNYLNDVWVLDTTEWKWTRCDIDEKQSRPSGRSMHTAMVYNDCMWVFGGYSGSEPLADFWCLDLETKIWTQVAFDRTKAPEARYGHSGVIMDMSLVFEAQAKKLYIEMMKSDIDKNEIKMPIIEKNQHHMVIMFGFSNLHAMYIGKITEALNTKNIGGTCFNDVWSFSFTTSKWHCLTDPSKSIYDDKDKNIITKVVDVTKGVTNATVSQVKGFGKQLGISGKTAWSEIARFTPFYSYSSTTSYGSVATTLDQPPDERYSSAAVNIGRGCILIFGGVRDYTHRRDCHILDLVNESFVPLPRMIKLNDSWPTARKGHVMIYDSNDDCVYVNGGSNFKQGIQAGVATVDVKQVVDLLKVGVGDLNISEEDDVVVKAENELKSTEKHLYEDVKIDKTQEEKNQLVKVIEAETIKIRKNPRNIEQYRTRADCYMKLKMWDKANLDVDEGLKIKPDDSDFKTKKGIIYYRLNDHISARLMLTDVISDEESKLVKGKFPNNLILRSYKIRAKCRIKERNFNEAINDANRFLKYVEMLDMIDVKEKKTVDYASIGSWMTSVYIVKATAFERKKQYDTGLTTIDSSKEQIQQFFKKASKAANFSFSSILSFKNEKPQDVYLREKLEKFERFLSEKRDRSLIVESLFEKAKNLLESYREKINKIDEIRMKEQEEIVEEESQTLDLFFEEYLFKEIDVNMEQSDCDQAIDLLKKVISFEPFGVKYIIALADAFYLKADYKQCVKYAKKVLEMAVDYWKAYFIIGSCYLSKRKVAKAIEFFAQGVENCEVVNAADEFLEMDGISVNEGFNQLKQALKDAEKKKETMQKAANLSIYAKQLFQQGNYEDALLTINEVIEKDPTNISYLSDKVDILLGKKKHLNALKVAVLASRISPKSYEGYLCQGVALQFLNRYHHSITVLEAAMRMFPENSNIKSQLMKSKDLYKKKQLAQMKYERALFIFQDVEKEIITENPKFTLYKINITSLEPSQKIITQIEQIVTLLDEAIDLYPHSADFYLSKARCKYLLRQYIHCVTHIKEAIEVMRQITDGLYLSFLSQRYKKADTDDEKKEDTVDRVNVDVIYEAISLGARAYTSMRQFDIATNYLKDMTFKHRAQKKKKIEDYERHLYLQSDHIGKLEDLTKKVEDLKRTRDKFDFLVKAGMNSKTKNDYYGAIRQFTEALALKVEDSEEKTQDDRDYASIYFERAECYYENQEFEKSIEDCRQAVKLESTFPHFYVLLCKALMESGNLEESIELCNSALAQSPFNTPLNDVWHNVKLQTASFEAERKFEEGKEAIEAGEFDVAISCLNKAIRLRPNNIEYLLARSRALFERQKFKKAIEDSGKVLKFDPKNIIAIRLHSDIHLELKNFSEAKTLLQKGMDMYPKDQTLRSRLEKLIRIESQWNEAYLRARDAEDCYANGNYEQALELYSSAIQLHSDCSQYLCRRARVLLKLSQPEIALKDAQEALLHDTSEEVYATLATIYLELCDYEKAKEVIEESLEFDDEESMDNLLLLKDEIYDRESKSVTAAEKDEEGQMFFENYTAFMKRKKEEIKQEIKDSKEEEDEGLYTSIFSALSIFSYGAKKQPIEIEEEDDSYEDLKKAQELFSEAVLLEPNNKRYLRHHVESLMLDKDPDRHEEALNQSATMIKMFPNYTDGFCTAAKLHAEKFRNTYESLFLSVMGLEHDRERQGLSVQILRTVLNIVDNYEIPIMKNSKTLRKLGKVQDKSEMAFDSAQAFEELEGHEIMDNVIGTINTPATKNKKETDQDVNVPSLSLDELLDGEDFEDLLKNTQDEATTPAVPVGKNRKSVKVFKISNRKEQVEFTKKLYEMDRQNNIMKDPFSNVRAVLTGFSRASVTILKSQREEAFNLAARAVFVMYFDVNIGMPSEKFNTLFNIVSEACFVGDDLKDYKLRELKKFGVKNLLLEECTTRYHRFVDSEDEHPFYSKKYFESDREYENFIETETKNIDEALSQFNLSLDDVKKRHDNGDEDVRYRHVIIQQFIDCILQYSLFTVEEKRSSSSLDSDDEDEKDEKLTKVKTKMLTLKDESLEVIQAVSNFYGYGDGVFAFLVLLEKLSRQFKHSYSEIGNIYKCLLHLVRTIITRNLSAAGKLKKKDKLLDDDPVIDRYYLTTSEKRIFAQAAKNINRELSFIIDNHWKSANETMDTIIMFAIKVSTLIHAFSCMADPDGINHGYKSLSIATKEGIENSMVNLFDYYRGKIITKLEEKDPNLQPDESGGLHPVQLLCLIEVLNEHLPRYETHFEPTFPSSVGVMKVVCNQVYSCIEIELHKLKSSKFRYYTERGELPLGLFDLPSKIEKIYQLLADHANVQPYALKDIFIPYVYKWIETFEKSATSWCKKAVDYGEWKPITPDVSYTTSVIDTFTSLRQSLIILEASLQFLKSEIQAPAQYASESILDSFRTLVESTNSKFGTGNSTLETLPLIYVTYTHVIATVIENYANMNLEIFIDNTMKMKKIEEEYVSRKTSAKYKDMLLKRKTTVQQQQQEEDLYEETRKDVHKQIVSKMGLCMNNILETINQVRSLSEDIHKQLLKQQSEIANQIEEYDLGSLDEDDESQSIDLSTSMGSSSYSQKKKDDLLEGMRMMHDTMKVLLSSLKAMIQEKMNNHLSQLIFKTMKESLIDTITKISQPGAVPSSPGTPTRSIPSTPTRTASSNRLPTNNLQPVVSEIDLNSLMTPLFDYLDDQLATLYSVLNDRVFEVVLRNIFNMLIDELKECAIPPADRPTLSRSQIEKFKTTFESFMDYFNANGSGLDVKYIKEHFDFISELFQLSLTSTKKLVDEYNEKSVQIEDVANLIETMNKDLARKDDGEDIHDLKDQISDAEEVKSKIIVTSNYIFAILHRRAIETRNKRMNDPDATKFVTSEMSLFEGNQAIINTDYDTFQKALKNAKDNYQQSKQLLDNLKKEIDGLKKKYKHVKSMRVITNERKQTRAKAKELRKEMENLYHQKAILELEKKNITEMVQNEAKMIESEFFDMESSDYLKDIVFRLDAFVRSCRKGLAGQLGEEFMNFLKFPTKITGAEEDVKLVITDFFRCMYRGNDGFICILSSPDICLSWIPISSLIKLFKLDVTIEATAKEYSMLHYLNPMTAIRGTASFFTSEPQYNTQIDYIKISIGKIKSVFRSTFGAGALDNSITVSKSEKEFQFSCFKDREKAFEVIQTFILKNASEFKAKDSSLVNKLLFINTTKEDDKDSDIASQQKIISKKGYPVSDVVRRTFNLKPETRLFNKYSCTDYDTKLIGEFYIFTDCLCFTTTVNSGSCLKMVLPYSQLLKISKVGKKNMNNRQCIQLTNEKRVSYSFVNFKNVEEVFQETIETIKKCCPEVNIVLKAENSIAFLVHPTVEANNGLLNMGKYSKFFKL